MSGAEILSGLKVFEGLSEDELTRVASLMSPVEHAAGAWVFQEGDAGDTLYVIQDGEVEVVQRFEDGSETVLAALGPGNVFGEMVLVDPGRRSAAIRCRVPTQLLTLVRKDFFELAAEDSDLGITVFLNLAVLLTGRLRAANAAARTAVEQHTPAAEPRASASKPGASLEALIRARAEVELELVTGSRLVGTLAHIEESIAGPLLTVVARDRSRHLVCASALAAVHTPSAEG